MVCTILSEMVTPKYTGHIVYEGCHGLETQLILSLERVARVNLYPGELKSSDFVGPVRSYRGMIANISVIMSQSWRGTSQSTQGCKAT